MSLHGCSAFEATIITDRVVDKGLVCYATNIMSKLFPGVPPKTQRIATAIKHLNHAAKNMSRWRTRHVSKVVCRLVTLLMREHLNLSCSLLHDNWSRSPRASASELERLEGLAWM